MKLLNLKQTAIRETDIVFCNSSLASGIAAVCCWACVGATIYLMIVGHIRNFDPPRLVSLFIGLFIWLFAWMTTNSWKASRRPTNWIVRIRGNEVLIKFRSFENWKMSDDDIQVVELNQSEIAFARELKRVVASEGLSSNSRVERRIDLEIGLKDPDTSALQQAIRDDIARPGWGNDRHRAKNLDYPVSVPEPGVIRIAWSNTTTRIRPRIKRALQEFSRLAPVLEMQTGSEDFSPTALRKLGEDELAKKLSELASRDQMSAIETIKQLYGCSLAEARQQVDDMLGKTKA
jgi:hypothetical protein